MVSRMYDGTSVSATQTAVYRNADITGTFERKEVPAERQF